MDENSLASTRIHEDVHYNQGFTAIEDAIKGRKFFYNWAGVVSFDAITVGLLESLDFESLTESEKSKIQNWTSFEIGAYITQLQADDGGKACLTDSERRKREDSIETYLNIQFKVL